MERFDIEKDISYFVKKYSLVELFFWYLDDLCVFEKRQC